MEYPEHEKVRAIRNESETIGAFLEWLRGSYSICEFSEDTRQYEPVRLSINNWLAKYFEIDELKLDDEKRQMLEVLRNEA